MRAKSESLLLLSRCSESRILPKCTSVAEPTVRVATPWPTGLWSWPHVRPDILLPIESSRSCVGRRLYNNRLWFRSLEFNTLKGIKAPAKISGAGTREAKGGRSEMGPRTEPGSHQKSQTGIADYLAAFSPINSATFGSMASAHIL
jgi:hypothetical protein